MPDQDAGDGAGPRLPGVPAAGFEDRDLEDPELHAEIDLVADLVLAASASPGPLTVAEIDRILGLAG